MNNVSYDEPRPEAVRDLNATLAAQQLGGAPASEELARNFLVHVQRDIDDQVDQRVQQRLATWKGAPVSSPGGDPRSIAVASLLIGGFLTLTRTTDLGTAGIAIVWGAIVAVNIVWAIVWLVLRILRV